MCVVAQHGAALWGLGSKMPTPDGVPKPSLPIPLKLRRLGCPGCRQPTPRSFVLCVCVYVCAWVSEVSEAPNEWVLVLRAGHSHRLPIVVGHRRSLAQPYGAAGPIPLCRWYEPVALLSVAGKSLRGHTSLPASPPLGLGVWPSGSLCRDSGFSEDGRALNPDR